jgi:hypothetical protein
LSVTSSDDLDSIGNCSTISGSLFLAGWEDLDTITLPPSLQAVTGGLFCSGASLNYTPDTIEATGLISVASNRSDPSIGGIGLVISDYQNLTTLNFPSLTSVGSNFVLARNELLDIIEGFSNLGRVGGNLDITGNFSSLEFPSLTSVGGNLNVESSNSSFECPSISRSIVNGTFVCKGDVTSPQPLVADNATTDITSHVTSSTTIIISTATGSAPSPSASQSAASSSRGFGNIC